MAKKKKKFGDDAWMWMSIPYVAGLVSLQASATKLRASNPPVFLEAPGWPSKPSSFIDNYLFYFFLPTPFEQIGTILDPMNLQTPAGRYRTAGGFSRLLIDIGGDVHMMKAALVPGMLPMREPADPFTTNPYTQAMYPEGIPDPMAQYPELNELFAASQS